MENGASTVCDCNSLTMIKQKPSDVVTDSDTGYDEMQELTM